MMNTVVGSAIGGLVAGAVALGAAATMRPSPAPAYGPDPNANGAYAMTVANTAPSILKQHCACAAVPAVRRGGVAPRARQRPRGHRRDLHHAQQRVCAARSYAQPVAYQQPVYRDDIVTRPVTRARTVSQPSRERVVTARREARSFVGQDGDDHRRRHGRRRRHRRIDRRQEGRADRRGRRRRRRDDLRVDETLARFVDGSVALPRSARREALARFVDGSVALPRSARREALPRFVSRPRLRRGAQFCAEKAGGARGKCPPRRLCHVGGGTGTLR